MARAWVFITIAAALLPAGCREDAPTYQDRTTREWSEQLLDAEPHRRQMAARALGHLITEDPAARAGLLAALEDESEMVRAQAAAGLVREPRNFDKAVPVLLACMDSNNAITLQAIITGFREMGDAAMPPLLKAVADDDPAIRQGAARTLAQIIKDNRERIWQVVTLLHDDSPPQAVDGVYLTLRFMDRKSVDDLEAIYLELIRGLSGQANATALTTLRRAIDAIKSGHTKSSPEPEFDEAPADTATP